jgi:hypothetical protein
MRRQITRYTTLTLALLGALAVGARAQERERQPAPVRERTFVFSAGPDEFRMDLRRGRMGINVDLRADVARDSIGARVAGVTPGGPADRAGVQTGDLITRVNGTRLVTAGGSDDEFESRPAERLLRIASRLDPGDTVRLDLRRGTQNLQLTFVAEASDMDRIVERIRVPMMRGVERSEGGEPRMRVFAMGGGPADLELVAVNPGLGDYFGTTEGLLVVDVGADTALGLRAGDVILQIGGRRPQGPTHAMRILSTYEGGEEVRFDIMRQKRRATVNGHMPRREARWRIEPNSFKIRVPRFDFEPLMRLHEELPQELMEMPHTRRRSPELQHMHEAPTTLIRTDGWT